MRFAFALFLASFTANAAISDPDWKAFAEEAMRHYQALVRLDTTNPPGNETRAVEYLKKVLEADGIASITGGVEPSRLNLIARLKGNGTKKPVLLMGHTDTVTIDPKKWIKHGPFSADREGGYVYGRGTSDDKKSVVAYLMTILTLKRLNVPLERDVIFLAEASEEAGADKYGAKWVADHYRDQIAAEFCLAEGGGMRRQGGKLIMNSIQTGEKIPKGATLVAHGPAGHGSRPLPDNAVVELAQAVAAVAAWTPPMRLNDTTRAYFERVAAISSPEDAARFNSVLRSDKGSEVQAWFKQHDPAHYSMITTSISPTIIKGGYQLNVIPSEAEAVLDIRMLPDEDQNAFYDAMRKIVNNPNVEVVPREALRPKTVPSSLNTDMFRALEKVEGRMFPGVRLIPTMSTGATDMAYMRELGTQCYGVGSATDVEDGPLGYGAHSDQERAREQDVQDFFRFAWNVVTEIAVRK